MEALLKIMQNPKLLVSLDGLRRPGLRVFHPGVGSSAPLGRTSAVARLAMSVGSVPTQLEAVQPIQRVMQPQQITTKLHELDQRRMRQAEHVKQLDWLLFKRPMHNMDVHLPFVKQPCDFRCNPYTNVKALLKREHDPKKLADKMVKLAKELVSERRKNKTLLENYRDLELRLFQYTCKENKNHSKCEIDLTKGHHFNQLVKDD